MKGTAINERFSSGVVGFPLNKDTEDIQLILRAFWRNGYTAKIEPAEGNTVMLYIGIPESERGN